MADSNFLYYTEVLSQPDLKFMSLLNANFQKRVETEKEEFLSIAKDAGQEVDLLLQDGECITYYRIDTMPEARRILSQATLEERKKRSETFLDGLEYRSRIPQECMIGERLMFSQIILWRRKRIRWGIGIICLFM